MASDHTVSVDFILVHFWSAVAFETEEHVALDHVPCSEPIQVTAGRQDFAILFLS